MKKYEIIEKILSRLGGSGSGHHGHKGRPGQRGGSAPGGGGWSYPPGTKMPSQPAVVESRPFLFYGTHLTGIRASEDEQKLISSAVESLDIPDYVGRHPSVWLSLDTRAGEELGLSSGLTTFVNPTIVHNRELLRKTLAHEMGHVIMRNSSGRVNQAFEQKWGKGPYPRETLGIDSIYHLQDSSELISNLLSKRLIGQKIPSVVDTFINEQMYDQNPWGAP